MHTKARFTLPALLLALLFCGLARAADLPWYTVEILVFTHLGDAALSEELWPDDPGVPPLTNALEVKRAGGLLDPELAGETVNGPVAYALLDPEEMTLNREAEYMRRSRYYRPLLHIAWRQPGFSRDDARPLHLITGLDRPLADRASAPAPSVDPWYIKPLAPLEGTLRLYREHYLHLDVDLLYSRLADDPGHPGSAPAYQEVPFSEDLPASLFRLRQSRRVRSGELHYFDHPVIAMLAQVTPYAPPEPPEPPEPEPAAGPVPPTPSR